MMYGIGILDNKEINELIRIYGDRVTVVHHSDP